eukprot:3941113-Rhodomonas_salina.4
MILEVARSHTVEESDMEEAAALKLNCYQTTRREVERNNQVIETRLMTFIISILGVLQQDSWERQLKGIGMTQGQPESSIGGGKYEGVCDGGTQAEQHLQLEDGGDQGCQV